MLGVAGIPTSGLHMMSFSEILHLPALMTSKTLPDAYPHPGLVDSAVRMQQDPGFIHLETHGQDDPGNPRVNKMKILSIGDDESLLDTRHLVLESAGFLVRSVASIGTVEESEVLGIDLALICHSVDLDRVSGMERFLKEINPSISILQLCKGCGGGIGNAGQIAPYEPRQLLVEIARALEDRLEASKSVIHATQISHAA